MKIAEWKFSREEKEKNYRTLKRSKFCKFWNVKMRKEESKKCIPPNKISGASIKAARKISIQNPYISININTCSSRYERYWTPSFGYVKFHKLCNKQPLYYLFNYRRKLFVHKFIYIIIMSYVYLSNNKLKCIEFQYNLPAYYHMTIQKFDITEMEDERWTKCFIEKHVRTNTFS